MAHHSPHNWMDWYEKIKKICVDPLYKTPSLHPWPCCHGLRVMRPHYHCRDTAAMLLGPVQQSPGGRHAMTHRSFNVTVHLKNRETFICQDKRTAQDKHCNIFITFHNHNFNITLKSHLPNC
jgi:hypothetical protein